ncbi:hypothetical protein HK405_002084, partial [Cladochytrium tenue]
MLSATTARLFPQLRPLAPTASLKALHSRTLSSSPRPADAAGANEGPRASAAPSVVVPSGAQSAKKPPLIGRHRVVPVELFRMGRTDRVQLRDYTRQVNMGRAAFDLLVHPDGLVHPRDGPLFE